MSGEVSTVDKQGLSVSSVQPSTPVRISLLNAQAKKLYKATKGAAGYDIFATHGVAIRARGSTIIGSGLCMEIPVGTCVLVKGRSSLAFHFDLVTFEGLIDSDYRGEIKLKMFNMSDEERLIKEGTRIAQLMFVKYGEPDIEYVEELSTTARGDGGFGSTGK